VIIRPASQADAAAVGAIYGHHVLNGLGSFEEIPPSDADMADRIASVVTRGLPYLVAEDGEGLVIGFAYASPYRPRAAYRFTAEVSVYVHPDFVGRGLGKLLMGRVVSVCDGLGLRQLVAVIGDSGNAGSIGLHRSLGFEMIGVGRGFGFKHGRWVDTVFMQRALGGGEAIPPGDGGMDL
jgi:phosphinothricin acetyltransferase